VAEHAKEELKEAEANVAKSSMKVAKAKSKVLANKKIID